MNKKNLQVFLPWVKLDVLFFLQNNKKKKTLFQMTLVGLLFSLCQSPKQNQILSNRDPSPTPRGSKSPLSSIPLLHHFPRLPVQRFLSLKAAGFLPHGVTRGHARCYSSRSRSQNSFLTSLGNADLRSCQLHDTPGIGMSFTAETEANDII